MEFTWDANKNQSNFAKHGISFEQASQVFDDPFQLVLENYFFAEDGEQRQTIVGMIRGLLLIAVVFVDRNDIVHIINARKAEKYEENLYQYNLPKG